MKLRDALLVLADGTTFEGEAIGADPAGPASGEVVFNTVLSGYQEVITDPSNAGQIITFTYPHIGNYGVNRADFESRRPFCRGVVVRELARRRSSWRSEADLDAQLRAYGIPGIAGIDTRKLTRILREKGAQNGCVVAAGALGQALDIEAALSAARNFPGLAGLDLAKVVSVDSAYPWSEGTWELGQGYRGAQAIAAQRPDQRSFRVVAFDYGVKRNILRLLADRGCQLTVLPATASAEEALACDPDGIFLANGPGDPAACKYASEATRVLVDRGLPTFGICLGHQMLALALGGATQKMHQGHHGANHPVKDLTTGVIEITSQNHNFAVAIDSLAGVAELTHVNLNDGVCEGLAAHDANAFGVQHHPEAGPGPHESSYLFSRFAARMAEYRGRSSFTVGRLRGHEPVGLPEPAAGVA